MDENSPYSLLIGARVVNDIETLKDAETRLLHQYLLMIRNEFRSNEHVRKAITEQTCDRKERIREACSAKALEDTDDIWNKALDILIEEHDRLVANPAQEYVVDEGTGLATIPITQRDVFTPPDYIDEDGKQRSARPILHPGKSSAIALVNHEQSRIQEALARHKGPAYDHLRQPSTIVEMAVEKLQSLGITIGPCDGKTEIIEIGREQVDGVLQAPNPSFHRTALFSTILAKRIAALGAKICHFDNLEMKSSAKQRWFDVTVTFAASVD